MPPDVGERHEQIGLNSPPVVQEEIGAKAGIAYGVQRAAAPPYWFPRCLPAEDGDLIATVGEAAAHEPRHIAEVGRRCRAIRPPKNLPEKTLTFGRELDARRPWLRLPNCRRNQQTKCTELLVTRQSDGVHLEASDMTAGFRTCAQPAAPRTLRRRRSTATGWRPCLTPALDAASHPNRGDGQKNRRLGAFSFRFLNRPNEKPAECA